MVNIIGNIRTASMQSGFIRAAKKEGTMPDLSISKNGNRVYSWLRRNGESVIESIDKNGKPIKTIHKTVETSPSIGAKTVQTQVINHKTDSYISAKLYSNTDGSNLAKVTTAPDEETGEYVTNYFHKIYKRK